ncbi:MAG: tRNA lysidine(34) synthetase TilS [Rickettsiales bacterium]|nr:tRNA lysidine(34) synthetase TilS [Rickettsiales bacterium]
MDNPISSLSIEHQVKEQLDQAFPNEYPKAMVVAVSGGSDSLALALILKRILTHSNTQLFALTVDHGMRAESKEEAQYVHQTLSRASIEHHILTWKGALPKANKQSEARKIRYRLIQDWCSKRNINHIVTAHHYDDQVETFVLRLLRGSSCYGLAGMDLVTTWNNISIIRPCLPFKKTYFSEYLSAHDISWVEDPSNTNLTYDRTYVRQFLNSDETGLPIDTSLLKKRLYHTTSHMKRVRSAIEFYVDLYLKEHVLQNPFGYCSFHKDTLNQIPEEVGLRALSHLLCFVSNNQTPPRFESLKHLYDMMCSNEPHDMTLHHCRIHFSAKKQEQGLVYISYEASASLGKINISDTKTIYDHRFSITGTYFSTHDDCFIQYLDKNLLNQMDESFRRTLPKLPKHILYSLPCITQNQNPIIVADIKSNKLTETADISIIMENGALID